MVKGCGKETPQDGSTSQEFGFLCLRDWDWEDGTRYIKGMVLEGGYGMASLGTKCGDLWGGDRDTFWQLVCTDCLRREGYLW